MLSASGQIWPTQTLIFSDSWKMSFGIFYNSSPTPNSSRENKLPSCRKKGEGEQNKGKNHFHKYFWDRKEIQALCRSQIWGGSNSLKSLSISFFRWKALILHYRVQFGCNLKCHFGGVLVIKSFSFLSLKGQFSWCGLLLRSNLKFHPPSLPPWKGSLYMTDFEKITNPVVYLYF